MSVWRSHLLPSQTKGTLSHVWHCWICRTAFGGRPFDPGIGPTRISGIRLGWRGPSRRQRHLLWSNKAGRIADLERTFGEQARAGIDTLASAIPAGQPTASPTRSTPIRIATARGDVIVVHNGIIENWAELKSELEGARSRVRFRHRHRSGRPSDRGDGRSAPRRSRSQGDASSRRLPGPGLMRTSDPQLLVGARRGSPLVVGLGEGENFHRLRHSCVSGTHPEDG